MSLLSTEPMLPPETATDLTALSLGESAKADVTVMQPEASPIEGKKKKYTKLLSVVLRAGCTLALLTYAFSHISWASILQNFHQIDDGEILIGVVIGVFGIIISSYQWQCLLDAEHLHFDLRHLINYYLIGITFNHFLPTGMGGDVVKAYYTGKEGKNTPGAASAVLTSRITGFIGMLCVALPALLIWHTLFSKAFIASFIISSLAMIMALISVFFGAGFLPRYIPGKWAQNRLVNTVLKISNTLHKSMKQPRSMCAAILFGMLFHISAALNYYSFGLMLDVHVPFAFYLVAIPFVSLIAFLPISINGFGLREGAFVGIFSIVHVNPASALVIVLLMDTETLCFGLLGGCIYLLMGMKKKAVLSTPSMPLDTSA